jgi:ferredoxin-NADP reductase
VPVLAVFQETEDIRTFRMLRPEDFEYAAGQFLTVRVQVDGKPLVRCYSISSPPGATGYLEISVKRQGVVSGMLHATVRPGSMLSVKHPAGKFTYPGGDDRPIVFLAGGVGVTPLISMFRHATASEPMRPATLILSVKEERQVPFRHELELLAERHPQAKVAIVSSGGPFALVAGGGAAGIGRFAGRINEDLLRKLVPDVANTIFMICGPGAMMEAMKELLSSLGVPPGQIRYEAFEAAIATSKEETVPGVKPARPTPAPAPAPAATGDGPQLTLQKSGVTVSVGAAQSLLEAAEAAGVSIDSSCRAGVCLTCRTRLLSGNVDCSSDSLDDDDRAAGYILPCISYAKGNCVLDA